MVDTQLKRYWTFVRAYHLGHHHYLVSLKSMAFNDKGKAGRLAAAFVAREEAA